MTAPTEGKALEACRKYDIWAREVRRLTTEISDHLSRCDLGTPHDYSLGQRNDEPFNHLAVAYARVPTAPDDDRCPTEHEVRERLKDCRHCLAAHEAISARRHAKKQFGVAKRRVRMIGRRAP